MPTWIVHGFRWPRAAIRIHIILQNLDDAAPEWLMAPATTACMTENFEKQWPEEMAKLPGFRLLEQYDPDDLTTKDQPYAYVCDQVHEIKLGIDFDELRGGGIGEEQWAAIAELRDKVAPGEKLGWFVVVNGDVERWAPGLDGEDEDTETEATQSQATQSQISPNSQRSSVGKASDVSGQSQGRTSSSRSLKSWIGGKLRKSKSGRDLRADTTEPVPPLPPMSPRAGLKASQINGKATAAPK